MDAPLIFLQEEAAAAHHDDKSKRKVSAHQYVLKILTLNIIGSDECPCSVARPPLALISHQVTHAPVPTQHDPVPADGTAPPNLHHPSTTHFIGTWETRT